MKNITVKTIKRVLKRLGRWLFYTVFLGLLPLLLKLTVSKMVGQELSYSIVCSEIYFLDLVLCVNGIRDASFISVEWVVLECKAKSVLLYTYVIDLAIISLLYGLLLPSEIVSVVVNWGIPVTCLIILTIITGVCSLGTQLMLGGVEDGE